ncbi:glycosyltransferase family 2 protein [Vibrio agarivorans]|uniref:glycosyltransferase family 2 protein n=1 Tax=Vibrio agarivorans TaxID=153622 RepID=UPI002232A1F3|nr:glycosyltransferase [Vibrio agarivorans]
MSNIIGYVDKASSDIVAGWAYDIDKNRYVNIEVMHNDTLIGSKSATVYREDLLALGYSDGCLGYEIPIIEQSFVDGDILTVIAVSSSGDRVKIDEVPVKVANKPSFQWNVDYFDERFLKGWVVECGNETEPVSLDIYIDGKVADTICCNIYREDLDKEGIAYGGCSFDYNMSNLLTDGLKHQVTLVVQSSSGKCLELLTKDIESKVRLTLDDVLVGNLETPKKNFIRGWIFVKNKELIKPQLDIFIDDIYIETIEASLMRPDVKEKFKNDGVCGFRCDIPNVYLDGVERSLKVIPQGNAGFSFETKKIKFKEEPITSKNQHLSLPKSSNHKGNIDNNGNRPVVVGWASDGSEDGAKISIYADGKRVGTLVAKLYREDLKKHNINKGYAGFEFPVPLSLMDGKEHLFEVRCGEGRFLISQKRISYSISRDYTNFDGYLRWSYFHREVLAPFREEDKRCFAYMDWLEKFDSNRFKIKYKSKSQPLVSIVMPTYNRGYVISNAIQSVIEQVYKNWELLIVDDGSADNTKEIVESFSDERIKFFEMPENGGVSKARNFALNQAAGTYISYLDTDNDWSDNFLLNMVGNLEENPGFKSAYSAQYIFKGSDRPYGIRFGLFNRTLLENRNYIDMNAFVHKRSLYRELGGFDSNLRRLVDYDLVLRYTEDNKPLAVKNILSNYYYNEGEETITVSENYQDAKLALESNKNSRSGGYVLSHEDIGFISDGGDQESFISHGADPTNVAKQSKRATVVIVSYNIHKILEKCVDSVLEYSDNELTDIVLVDNNSDSETIELLRSYEGFKNVRVIYNNDNKGFTEAVNQGIEISDPESNIVLLNNDAIATAGWLVEMEIVATRNHDAGIIAPQQVLFGNTKTINTHVPYADKNTEIDVTVSHHHNNLVLDGFDNPTPEFKVDFIPFFCVYITRDVLNTVGLLDSKLGRHYRSDRLYCYSTIYNAGKSIYFTPMSKLYHLHQQSTTHLKKKDDKEYDVMFVKNTWDDPASRPSWDY